jgi:hypothetical protein
MLKSLHTPLSNPAPFWWVSVCLCVCLVVCLHWTKAINLLRTWFCIDAMSQIGQQKMKRKNFWEYPNSFLWSEDEHPAKKKSHGIWLLNCVCAHILAKKTSLPQDFRRRPSETSWTSSHRPTRSACNAWSGAGESDRSRCTSASAQSSWWSWSERMQKQTELCENSDRETRYNRNSTEDGRKDRKQIGQCNYDYNCFARMECEMVSRRVHNTKELRNELVIFIPETQLFPQHLPNDIKTRRIQKQTFLRNTGLVWPPKPDCLRS